MKMKKFLNKIKFFTSLFTFNFILITGALSEQLKSINIEGNERLADETIILFSNLKIGDNIDPNIVNNTFKNLFQTDYFKDLKINFDSGKLNIIVKENPIIQEIKIKGIKNKSILSELEKITRKTEKYPFISSNVMKQKNELNNIVRINGFYFADIKAEIIDNSNNSVNLIYYFNLVKRAKISEIVFTGNKVFKSRKLRKIILSE